jgi:pimeloyl-ACP methyl ester carboxylesterase
MSTRTIGFAIALFLIRASSDAAATPGSVEGDWIGGFDGQDGTVYISAHFEPKGEGGEALSGRIDLPLRGDHQIALKNVTARDSKLSFEVPGTFGNLLFEGRRERDTLSGWVRQARSTSRFEMIKIARVSDDTMAQIAGDYELEPGRVVLITRTPSGPLYLDHAGGRMGLLYPIDERTFVSGPSLVAGYPVELTITFDAPAFDAAAPGVPASDSPASDSTTSGLAGSVASGRRLAPALTWQPTGKPAQRAERKTYYTSEPVRFANGSIYIGASLLLPSGPGPHPAIVMIHGSGAVTRDALHPYADIFARNGIAVLMPDKRGSGSSTGNWARATFDDLADDALAGVAYLRTRPEINARQIGLQGSSLGGWVAPLAASRSADVAFVVVESAPVLTPIEHERLRVRSQLRADGFAPPLVAKAMAFMDQKFAVARTGEGWTKLQDAMARAEQEGWLSYVNPPTTLDSLQWQWQHVLSYDPLPALQRLTCPVLVLYGELDTIVPPAENRKRMQDVLAQAGNRDATIKVFEHANHGFFTAITGGRREAAALKGLVPGYLDIRVDWVRQHVTPATARVAPPPTAALRQTS